MKRRWNFLLVLTACLIFGGCVVEPTSQPRNNAASPLPSATVSPSPIASGASSKQSLTLPVLDAFFADESFAGSLKTRLQLTDEQVTKLKELAPWGLAMTKEMINRSASSDYSGALAMEAFTQTLLMTAQDFREFHAAFNGKRRPQFRGR